MVVNQSLSRVIRRLATGHQVGRSQEYRCPLSPSLSPFHKSQLVPILKNMDKAKQFTDFLEEIAAENADSPAIVYNVDDIVKKIKRWSEKMENIDAYYFVPCNPNPLIIAIMSAYGLNFSCCSATDMELVFSIKPDANLIVSNPHKTNHVIRTASVKKVEFLVVDCEFELKKIKDKHPSAQVLLRLRIPQIKGDETVKEHCKYGVDPKESRNLFRVARELSVEFVGASFHVGTNCLEPLLFNAALRDAGEVFTIGVEMGFDMWLLNIGGGFPGTHDIILSECEGFNQMTRKISRGLSSFQKNEKFKVIAEPGRFFIESSGWLVVRIIGKRLVATESDDDCWHYHVNESCKKGLLSVYRDKPFRPEPVPILDKSSKRKIYSSVVWGNTGSIDDWIVKDVNLPEMMLGEYLAFQNCGAYLPSYPGNCCQNDLDFQPVIKYFVSNKVRDDLSRTVAWPKLEQFIGKPDLNEQTKDKKNAGVDVRKKSVKFTVKKH